MTLPNAKQSRSFPLHGWIGLFLALLFWYLNWTLPGLRTHYGFFFLWLGFILTVDGLNYFRASSSLLTRNRRYFLALFALSIPVWWLFEWIDERTQYWHYEGAEFFTNLEYFLLASLSFSTVIPAVFECADLVSHSKIFRRRIKGPKIPATSAVAATFLTIGILMAALLMWRPQYFPYFTWTSLYFITEALNVWLGNRTLLDHTKNGDWTPAVILAVGCLICGFFWEMWNYYSYPKWIYDVPNFNFWHIFEMPAAGYLGYIPFSFELYAFYNLFFGLFNREKAAGYFSISS